MVIRDGDTVFVDIQPQELWTMKSELTRAIHVKMFQELPKDQSTSDASSWD
jgi:hypothetical protein